MTDDTAPNDLAQPINGRNRTKAKRVHSKLLRKEGNQCNHQCDSEGVDKCHDFHSDVHHVSNAILPFQLPVFSWLRVKKPGRYKTGRVDSKQCLQRGENITLV